MACHVQTFHLTLQCQNLLHSPNKHLEYHHSHNTALQTPLSINMHVSSILITNEHSRKHVLQGNTKLDNGQEYFMNHIHSYRTVKTLAVK